MNYNQFALNIFAILKQGNNLQLKCKTMLIFKPYYLLSIYIQTMSLSQPISKQLITFKSVNILWISLTLCIRLCASSKTRKPADFTPIT